MSIRNGKYFHYVEHPKPNLSDLPPSCKNLCKRNEEIYDYDFKKFLRPSPQSTATRLKNSFNNQNTINNYYSSSSKNNDLYGTKKQSYSSNLNGVLNFDYDNLQIDSNHNSKNDQSHQNNYNKSSKNDNFFTNKISMVPPGENIYSDKSSKNTNQNVYDRSKNNHNFNDGRSSNYGFDNSTSTNYNSNKYNFDSQPKVSSIQNYDYIDKTSSKRSNVPQTSNQTQRSKSSKQYTSSSNVNLDNPISQVKNSQNAFSTKTNMPSNAHKSSTTNSSFTSKINSSTKTGSSRQTSLYSNDIENNSKFSKKAPVYDYSKPNPAGAYNPESSSHAKSYKSSSKSTTGNIGDHNNYNIQNQPSSTSMASSKSTNISSRNNYNIQNQPSSVHHTSTSVTSSASTNINSRNNYNIQNQPSSIRHTSTSVTSSTSTNISNRNNYNIQNQPSSIHHAPTSTSSSAATSISNRNNYNIKNQPSSMQSTSTVTTSSRQQYSSTNSKFTTNSVRGSKSSVSNQNTRFTTTSDLLNQTPQNYGNGSLHSQSSMQKQTRTSMQQPYYGDIPPPNLTQYSRPQVGSSSAFTNNQVTTTTTTTSTNSQAQFIAHQAQYSGSKDVPSNPPTQSYLKKSAISNPGYDFLQSNMQNQSQSQSLMNEGAQGNDSFTIDPVPKKTRVEFPEPQTAPKPFQIIDASLEGEVSQEEVKKVEDINELMKSFHADSDSENNLDEIDNNNNSITNKNKVEKQKPTPSFNVDDIKKDLFSLLYEEEEEEAQIDMDIQEDNEKNNQPLEDLSVFDDIEQKSKDFDDQNINIQVYEEDEEEHESNKLEIASSEDSPNDSAFPKESKEQKNVKPNPVQNNYTDEEDMKEIQSFFDKIKKSIGNEEEEEEENTADFIKQLEEDNFNYQSQTKQNNQNEDQVDDNLIEDDQIEEDLIEDNQNDNNLINDVFIEEEEEEDFNSNVKSKKQKSNNQNNKNKEEIQNEDKTVEDVFLEEEENESMIEKVDADICLSDDYDENKISIEKFEKEDKKDELNDLNLDMGNEEDESETDASIEAILKKANEQHLISDGNFEEEEDESFANEENRTPTSHFKTPLKFLAENINNKYSSNNNGLELAFELADKILKKQLKKILSL